MIVTVPPLVDVANAIPDESADMPLVSCADEDMSVGEAARVNVTEATTLFGFAEEFSPHATQVAVPTPFLQESVLLAAAGPGATVADVKSVVE